MARKSQAQPAPDQLSDQKQCMYLVYIATSAQAYTSAGGTQVAVKACRHPDRCPTGRRGSLRGWNRDVPCDTCELFVQVAPSRRSSSMREEAVQLEEERKRSAGELSERNPNAR